VNTTTSCDPLALSASILLVEDEPVLRSSLARGLSRLPNVEVLAAGTVDEAVTFLATRSPSLLISDIDLPGASGLDLVAELGRRDIDVPIILVTAYLNSYRERIPTNPNLLVLEKPVPLDDLRTRVKHLLRPPCNLIEYVQATCTSGRSACVDIELGSGTAQVIIYNGEVWSAEDAQGSGPGAFQRLAYVSRAQMRCGALVHQPGPRNITTRWEQLVLDLACPPDTLAPSEGSPVVEASPLFPDLAPTEAWEDAPNPTVPNAPPPRPARPPARTLRGIPQVAPEDLRDCEAAPSFDELWAFAVDAVLQRRHAIAARAFRAAGELRPGHPGVLANLRRLTEMGYGGEDARDDDN
jgi:CheY-like chemotaxis protein